MVFHKTEQDPGLPRRRLGSAHAEAEFEILLVLICFSTQVGARVAQKMLLGIFQVQKMRFSKYRIHRSIGDMNSLVVSPHYAD